MGDGLRVSGHDGQIPDDRGEIASSRCLATLMGLTFLLVPSSCDRGLKWVNGVCSSSKEYYSFLFSGLDNLAMGKKDFLLLLLLSSFDDVVGFIMRYIVIGINPFELWIIYR